MCVTCGCNDYDNRHDDSRNLTDLDFQSAANAAEIPLSTVLSNIIHAFATDDELDDTPGTPPPAPPQNVDMNIVKSSAEQQYTLGVAYAANLADSGRAKDGFQDFADAETLEKAAWNYLQKSGTVGLHHAEGTTGAGKVVESYIYRGPDWPQDNGYIVKSGDWLIGVLWNDEGWNLVKSGKINGFSPQGKAKRAMPDPSKLGNLRKR